MNAISHLNDAPDGVAAAELSQCCASGRWVDEVAAARPYQDVESLLAASNASLQTLTWADVSEALAAHPRIGAAATGADRESAWSRQEQAGATAAGADVKPLLASLNRSYEDRFGHVFLICASGLTATEMLASLRQRLDNDDNTERDVVAAELAKIVALRLKKAFA